MRHYPVFLDLDGRRVVVAGAGETAAAKLRLLCKTGARLRVIGEDPADAVRALADAGAITLETRPFTPEDAEWAALLYAAHDDPARDAAAASAGRAAGALVNVVDDLEASDFITPAIVDRDPVTVAIGTEGTAPVLARDLKARIEAMLPAQTGALARIAALFRDAAARLPKGRARRAFWRRYFSGEGAAAYAYINSDLSVKLLNKSGH